MLYCTDRLVDIIEKDCLFIGRTEINTYIVYMIHEILQLLYLHQRYCVDYGRGEKCGKYDLLQGNIPVLSGKTKKNSDTRKCYCSIMD
jgi:hypothetical protein